jgi:fructan beta-fructosidase
MNLDYQKSELIVTSYKEQFRPQFHFSPQEKWMNDPNGLVYHKGVYHLFYQYYPDDIVWGPMHWGHAISKDLISWEHKPIALFPDSHGDIFSGSAVVDIHNTSGFGTKENPPLVAIYTYHLMEGEQAGRNDFQTQGIAYSLDNGDTWTKYDENPVIGNEGIKDFRDPKVFWHEESKKWIMALVAGDHAKFYSSDNLKDWNYLSDFGKDKGAHGGVWECPDLFKLKVEGIDEEKWVLLISINPGAPNGGSGTQYFIGDFDGKSFKAENRDEKWIDYGADNYAGVTYNNTPNKERIFIGWMSNWNYAAKTPTEKWRSAMTLPREITLAKEGGLYYLKNNVVRSFDKYTTNVVQKDSIHLSEKFVLDNKKFNQIELKFRMNIAKDLKLEFKNLTHESLAFELNPSKKEMLIDRRKSGLINFEERFADKGHTMPYNPSDKEIDVRIILDWSSIEIFIDNGRYVMTEQIFPTEIYSSLELSSTDQAKINHFKINAIKTIW